MEIFLRFFGILELEGNLRLFGFIFLVIDVGVDIVGERCCDFLEVLCGVLIMFWFGC